MNQKYTSLFKHIWNIYSHILGRIANLKQMPEDLYVLIFCSCHNGLPQTQQLKRTQIYYQSSIGQKPKMALTGLKSKCRQAVFLPGGSRGESVSLLFLVSRGVHDSQPSSSIFKVSSIRLNPPHADTSLVLSPSLFYLLLHWVHLANAG